MANHSAQKATRVLAVVAIASIVTATVQQFHIARDHAEAARRRSVPRWVGADAVATNPTPLLPHHPHAPTPHTPRRTHIS